MITENGAESEAETEAKTEAETEKEAETGAENQAEGESNKEQCQLALQDHVSKVPPTPSPPPSQAHNYGYYMNSIAGKIADWIQFLMNSAIDFSIRNFLIHIADAKM